MNALAPITADTSELVITIERARLAFDAGDVQAAFLLSSGAYEQAKAAGRYAEKVKASREMIDKARRMQADALKIESLCTVAMADAVDEAQTQGKLSRGGRPETVQGEDRFSLEDVGIDKRRLHEARHLRNAERAQPGFIDRVVEARVNEGLEPSRASIKTAAGHAIGTKSRSQEERGVNAYFTHECAVATLLALESFSADVLEPACGDGGISRPMEAAGYTMELADIVDRGLANRHGELQRVEDFLQSRPSDLGRDIVTNPPYGKEILNRFVAHALRTHRPRKMALLLNLNFMCGCEDKDRIFAMEKCPPSRVYVFTRRLPMMHQEGWTGPEASSQMNTAWFVWEQNEDGSYGQGFPQLIRIDWRKFEGVAALLPGAGGHVGPVCRPVADQEEPKRTTPVKTIDQRVEEEFERAMLWIKHLEPFDLRRFRSNVAVREDVAKALLDAMQFNGLIEPAGDGQWVISSRGISSAIDVAAVVATREWRARAANCGPDTISGKQTSLVIGDEFHGAVDVVVDASAAPTEADPLYASVLALTAETGRASVDYFKRELKLGHAKAAGLMARLIAEGLVSEPDAAGRRTVFIEKIKGAM
ncbi:DNA translocase FtsK [Agrobacterium vitis]|uniref:DNA translocase FtsK n=1 Tax=Agrobacterium vitis TaxID=373 RepID=UPI0008DBECFF|nr:DNA translocase FtsK [Agrobacterium vitis]MUO84011.1 hypothetical protein [Agrobacterium vitis]